MSYATDKGATRGRYDWIQMIFNKANEAMEIMRNQISINYRTINRNRIWFVIFWDNPLHACLWYSMLKQLAFYIEQTTPLMFVVSLDCFYFSIKDSI